ncbi:MAG: hypothetical protein GXO56_07785 [Chloroflexi bacterium]|nr:hypothetical protein [Chloroflexota bacterium]
MAREFDGVIDAVHHDADGKVAWARVYLRRWPHVYGGPQILPREVLVERLQAGQSFAVGRRQALWGNLFEIQAPVRVSGQEGDARLTLQEGESYELASAPKL